MKSLTFLIYLYSIDVIITWWLSFISYDSISYIRLLIIKHCLNIAEIVACWIFEGHPGDAQEGIFGP